MAVYGKLEDILKQNIFNGKIKSGLEYLAGMNKNFLFDKPEGYIERVEISGQDVYASHQVYKTKLVKEARFEVHREYIDLQYVWAGRELITITGMDNLTVPSPYDKQKDIQFFEYFAAASLVMKEGMLAVFYPQDAHAPGISLKQRQLVRKTVVKVKYGV
ncbi:MAG: YhcH/YjgK/YiaL family protein [Candidatus Omnitrophota bacterium]